jgi:hypothetical protein
LNSALPRRLVPRWFQGIGRQEDFSPMPAAFPGNALELAHKPVYCVSPFVSN